MWASVYVMSLFVATLASGAESFIVSPQFSQRSCGVQNTVSLNNSNDDNDESKKLLEKAAQIRAEIAALENRSVEEVTQEARDRKKEAKERRLKKQQQQQQQRFSSSSSTTTAKTPHPSDDGRFLQVPDTTEEQIRQAARAVEDAFRAGLTRQTVRLALIREGKAVSGDVEAWPGGAKQMYNVAAKPLTESLLKEIRACPPPSSSLETADAQTAKLVDEFLPPTVTSQDVWDFDGSGVVTAQAAGGPAADVQALVFPNTDVKYLRDIRAMDEIMGRRLFLLVNPFWRDVNSWGFNILAPNAKKMAQAAVFDRGYEETYVLQRFSARGENCVALKMYPYDWQLYAYREVDDYYRGRQAEEAIRLGSSKEEPNSSLFTELLNERPEFKYSRNMRQMMK